MWWTIGHQDISSRSFESYKLWGAAPVDLTDTRSDWELGNLEVMATPWNVLQQILSQWVQYGKVHFLSRNINECAWSTKMLGRWQMWNWCLCEYPDPRFPNRLLPICTWPSLSLSVSSCVFISAELLFPAEKIHSEILLHDHYKSYFSSRGLNSVTQWIVYLWYYLCNK